VRIPLNHSPNIPKSGFRVASEPPEEGQVLKQFESHFDGWDANGNGQIAWSEIRQRMTSSECEKDEAVALAALYGLVSYDASYRGLERKSPVTYNRLYDLYYDYSDDNDQPIADGLYKKYAEKLVDATDELFPDILPNGFLGKQGTGPSCGFLATTFSQLVKNPSAVKNAIRKTDDGRIEVKFPGLEKSVIVDPVTDTEQALFASAGGNGNWLATLEKAWGTHQAGGDQTRAFEMDTFPEDAIEAWTGGKATTARIPKNPKPTKDGELPEYLRTVSKELAANHVVVAWTRSGGLTQEGLVPGHAYTLNGVDHEDGSVSLRNPWGHMEPKGKDGQASDGFDDGVFDFPLEEFHKNFGNIARQTD
jgi:calpain family cysteine protease